MNSSRLRRSVGIAIPVLTVLILFIDWLTPEGIVDWVLYFIPLLLTFYANRRYSPVLMAAVFSVLTVIGFYLSPPGMNPGIALVNLLLGLGTLWVVAFLVDRLRRSLNETRTMSAAVRQSPSIVIITDLSGRIEYANPKFAEVTGYSVREALGQNPRILKSGRHPEGFYKNLWDTLLKGKVWRGEFQNKKKSGDLYWESACISPVRGETGTITHFVAIKEDITERKRSAEALERAERELLESARRQKTIINNIPDTVWLRDLEGRYLAVNKAWCEVFGIDETKAIGKTDHDLLPAEVARRFREVDLQVISSGKPLRLEEKLTLAGKGTIWSEVFLAPLTDEHGRCWGTTGIARDITHRKQAGEELQRKTALLEAQVNSSIDGILVVNEQGRKTLQNQRVTDLLKIPQAIADDPDDDKQRSWVAQNVKNTEQFIARVNYLNAHRNETTRDEIEMKDGTILDRYSAPMTGKDGEYYGRIWTFRDITQRKRAEESLREGEERYRALLETTGTGFDILDENGKIVDANDEYVRLTGHERLEEILGRHVTDWTAVRQRNNSRQGISRCLENGRVRGLEVEYVDRYGKITPVEINATVIQTKQGKRVMALCRDITERKRAEETLRASEEKFRQLADNISDVFWITSPDLGAIHYVSAGYEAIWGRSTESLYAHPHQWVEAILPEERGRVFAVFATLMQNEPQVSVEYPITRPDGTIRWIHDRGFQVRDAAGKLVRLTGIARDVTDQKQLAVQLHQAQKLEAIGQLAAGIAHEINTPTQYVGDNIRFLQSAFHAFQQVCDSQKDLMGAAAGNRLTPELLAHCQQVFQTSESEFLCQQVPTAINETLAGIDRIAGIVRAMKEFSHPGDKEKSPADLNQAIESTVTVARNEWKYVAEMKLDLDPALPAVPCYVGEFNQAILNLVVNAAHAVGDVVQKQPGTMGAITIRTRNVGKHAEVRVTDTGCGIPGAIQRRIFEPFFTTKEVGKGTGQGLAMVYNSIVKRHRGTVTFESEPGRGTTFILRLPLAPEFANQTELVRRQDLAVPAA